MFRLLGLIFIINLFSLDLIGQSGNLLHSGDWFKIGVTKKGVYKLDYDYLKGRGFDLKGVSKNTIRIFGNGGNGILSQENSAPRPLGLQENAIYVSTGGQTFQENDYILFYGNSPHRVEYSELSRRFTYEEHYYSDTTYYFLTLGDEGQRIENLVFNESAISNNEVLHFSYYDENSFNLLNSGRDWYGANFDRPGRNRTIELKVPEFSQDASHFIEVSSIASAIEPSEFSVSVGDISLGSYNIQGRVNFDNPTYAYKGLSTFSTQNASEDGRLKFRIGFNSNSSSAFGFLDKILVTTNTDLIYNEGTYLFTIPQRDQVNEVLISGYESGLRLWDITDPIAPASVEIDQSGSFKIRTDTVRNLILFHLDNTLQPAEFFRIPNQDVSSIPASELLIITHKKFEAEANRLAEHRRSITGVTSQVVTVNEIYNEFGSGMQDITAIRDFIRYMWKKGELKYVLLFGDASYDYKDRIDNNTNFVPNYQTRLSLSETFSFCSDDYYTFMEEDEGRWSENSSGIHTMDISVGRLPVKTIEEAGVIVDKLIYYDMELELGSWTTRLLFSADDGDGNLHARDADVIANNMDEAGFQWVSKMYIDEYAQPNGLAQEAEKDFERKMHEGVLVANYVGHGNQEQLAAENLVSDRGIKKWTNKNRLPFYLTATCDFGNYDNPVWFSAGEWLLLSEAGGGIGLITATRPVYSNTNYLLNNNFNQELLQSLKSGIEPIGEIFQRMKNKSYTGISNRNYVLLGDPSMTLAYPKYSVKMDSLIVGGEKVQSFSAFEEVTFFGSIVDKMGDHMSDFSGLAEIVILDEPVTKTTLGIDNEPFAYSERTSILYSGKATVSNGTFQLDVLLPESYNGETTNAKILLYAKSSEERRAAVGGATETIVNSGTRIADTKPPDIQVFIGDTLFQSGNTVSTNSRLLIRLTDSSGINLSSVKKDQLLKARLNEDTIILNTYYQADPDTYKSGWINYDFMGLKPGDYTLSVQASDNAGNVAVKMVAFSVVKSSRLPINDFKVFPNPASSEDVTFSFIQDRPGETIGVECLIFSLKGQTVNKKEILFNEAPLTISFEGWTIEDRIKANIQPGIYLFTVTIRALSDGAQNIRKGRLIMF